MFEHLFNYFQEEITLKNRKHELEEGNKNRNRFMYFFAIVFIFLFICSFFNII